MVGGRFNLCLKNISGLTIFSILIMKKIVSRIYDPKSFIRNRITVYYIGSC